VTVAALSAIAHQVRRAVVHDEKLSALQAAIGAQAWRDRVEVARERERLVKAVLTRGGACLPAAREIVGAQKASTVVKWVGRWLSGGLEELIDRRGVVSHTRALEAPLPLGRRGRAPRDAHRKANSFVKWAGSKAAVVGDLLAHAPESFGRYYEPMVGSGVMFLKLQPARAVLNDANDELMNCYRVIRDDLPRLLAALARHVNTYEHFIAVRGRDPGPLPPVARAARTIFLNKTCFNGLYRVNKRGQFNVPYGRIPHASWIDRAGLERVRAALHPRVTLRSGDVEQAVRDARAGDLVYFDPPYAPSGRDTPTFVGYGVARFGVDDHRRLACLVRSLADRGVHILLSNSDTPLVRELYAGFNLTPITVARRIAVHARRRSWSELIVSTTQPRCDPDDAADVLFGYGPLDSARAAEIVKRELECSPESARAGIEAAERAGRIDRPSPRAVRSFRPSARDYDSAAWDLCVTNSAPRDPISTQALVAAGADWARANLGLRAGDEDVRRRLGAAVDRLVRSGELVRASHGRIRRP